MTDAFIVLGCPGLLADVASTSSSKVNLSPLFVIITVHFEKALGVDVILKIVTSPLAF